VWGGARVVDRRRTRGDIVVRGAKGGKGAVSMEVL